MRRVAACLMASTRKPTLKPGFGLGDWLNLQKVTTAKCSGKVTITQEELSRHASRYDCWMAIDGKVYDITQYVPYHPGGEDVLLKGAGKDCSVLFKKFHAWVNAESLLSRQLVGLYAGDEPAPPNAGAKASRAKETATDQAIVETVVFRAPKEVAKEEESSEDHELQATAIRLLEEIKDK